MSPDPPIRILIADDHGLVRAGIRALLEKVSGVTVVAEAQDGQEALDMIESTRPDIVLADIAMPRVNGLTLAERLTAEVPDVRVIILTMYESEGHVALALEAGASATSSKGQVSPSSNLPLRLWLPEERI
jgi:DNA-binding NarL/FixJ family response regulator